MARESAWRGTWKPNKRPFVTIAPDAYVAIQGETSVIGCGECRRQVNLNDFVTAISTEASVDSSPGSGTVQLTVPDNSVNDFYVNGQLIIIPMMEIEFFAKGYYLIGGLPQYYRIFWGLVSSVTKSWSNGVTTINISCKDILRWWEITNVTKNPAFLNPIGTSAGGYVLLQNQFAGENPYTTIVHLAHEAMGDFSFSTGSMTSYNPETVGPETQATAKAVGDVMLYWQLKFGRIWNSLVLYGASGQMYTTSGDGSTIQPNELSAKIFEQEWLYSKDQAQVNSTVKLSPAEIATFKKDIPRAGEVEFFQNDTMTKMALANQAKDQISYEFFCDPCGDIVFKPPFYNLNVLPNKPVSWIQDFEIIDDSVTESETEVWTHIVGSGNAFGGTTDWGISDEFTTPRSGVFDYHLLRRYGWRRYDYQCEWAGNPRKLFFHMMDMLDRLNAKRQNGTVTIPLRPELRLGFPIWFPKYDSFYYVNGISHSYAVGGQATTTLTLTAKRTKFVAPSNIGTIDVNGEVTLPTYSRSTESTAKPTGKKKTPDPMKPDGKTMKVRSFKVDFPSNIGDTSGSSTYGAQGAPVILRNPKTGSLLGYPNVVMVYRSTLSGVKLAEIIQGTGSPKAAAKKATTKSPSDSGGSLDYARMVSDINTYVSKANRDELIGRIRLNRYEAAASNAGAYDYAHDVKRVFKEFQIVPADSITYAKNTTISTDSDAKIKDEISKVTAKIAKLKKVVTTDEGKLAKARRKLTEVTSKVKPVSTYEDYVARAAAIEKAGGTGPVGLASAEVKALSELLAIDSAAVEAARAELADLKAKIAFPKKIPNLNIIIRPVSDEFGFEVIGHYRYGRGAFMDRGKVQLPDNRSKTTSEAWNSVINKINIQFSPTGGLLTDGITTEDGSMMNFAAAFETMRPEDWATGAHFKGIATNGVDKVTDILMTSVSTFSADVNQSAGRSVFIEADSTRRALTLAEMKPTVDAGKLSSAVDDCNCGLGRFDWLGILPISAIEAVLSGPGKTLDNGPLDQGVNEARSEIASFMKEVTRESPETSTPGVFSVTAGASTSVITGGFNSGTFFSKLREYLSGEFNRKIHQNDTREETYSGEALGISVPFEPAPGMGGEDNNILTPPGDALFDRASRGDAEALEALQNQANFDFGLTKAAAQDLHDTWNSQPNIFSDTLGVGSLREFAEKSGKLFLPDKTALAAGIKDISTNDPAKQGQPYPPPNPNFNNIINGGQYSEANVATSPIDPSTKT